MAPVTAKQVSGGGLLGGIVVETPATRRGSRYAWIPIQAFRKLSAGGLKLFAVLSGLHRPRKALALSASECAASLGCCERSLRYWRRELEREGWLEPGCLMIRRANRLRKGYRARVDVTKLAVMSPASLRAYVAVTFATRDGVRQRTYEAIAKTLGRSRQALWAALKPVRVVGIALADRARSAIRAVKQVTASTARGRGDRDVEGWKRSIARLLQERTPGT